MALSDFDPEILQDFLTESGELLEQLEGDLVVLESTPTDPELLNQVFRALHTIKGSASFLAFTNLVEIAHAAETALNAARTGEAVVDKAVMDLLLEAVDVLKGHFEQLGEGDTELTKAEPRLVAALTAVADGEPQTEESAVATAQSDPESAEPVVGPMGANVSKLDLSSDKADLVDFLVTDLEQTLEDVDRKLEVLAKDITTEGVSGDLSDLGDSIAKNAEFFDCGSMKELAETFITVAEALGNIDQAVAPQVVRRLQGVSMLICEQTKGIGAGQMLDWPIDTLIERIEDLAQGGSLGDDAVIPNDADAAEVLMIDGVISHIDSDSSPSEPAAEPAAEVPSDSKADLAPEARAQPGTNEARAQTVGAGVKPNAEPKTKTEPKSDEHSHKRVEQTIRVDVERLESLMNLVGELVLQKNRVGALTRELANEHNISQDRRELFTTAASDLDRTTGDIQVAVMRTRMQPLDKLFGRYPRLIRDLAGKTGKKIHLEIIGGETEVDKSVIEELGDPLVHLMRNSADHGLEPPEERLASGKGDEGTITLQAAHCGSHVEILIKDNGRGLNRDKLGGLAVKRGIVTETELESLSDQEVFRFIFAAGFSTAEVVSDLSGRGVGMDVVRTNIEKLKGTVDVDSVVGEGTTISIVIPLTVAIMPAMMVAVGPEKYAIPLDKIIEIVRPTPDQVSTIGKSPVLRLREDVLPMMNSGEVFALPKEQCGEMPFAVVLATQGKQVALMVSEPIGQQEIVIKPLDGAGSTDGPVSGATVRDDGGVSLIVDVGELIRIAEGRSSAVNART